MSYAAKHRCYPRTGDADRPDSEARVGVSSHGHMRSTTIAQKKKRTTPINAFLVSILRVSLHIQPPSRTGRCRPRTKVRLHRPPGKRVPGDSSVPARAQYSHFLYLNEQMVDHGNPARKRHHVTTPQINWRRWLSTARNAHQLQLMFRYIPLEILEVPSIRISWRSGTTPR